MPLKVNVLSLARKSEHVTGELPAAEIAEGYRDELVSMGSPLAYDLDLEHQADGILMTGRLAMTVNCRCRRCLESFEQAVEIPAFAAVVPLEGEGAATCDGDFADLTPFLREDMYLVLPTNPLCSPNCCGLLKKSAEGVPDSEPPEDSGESPWGALDQLKL